jgi:hypothetical protein
MFDQRITVPSPTLWYPNNSTFGKPYLYKVFHVVSVNGVVVDSAQTTLGIRTITWDKNLPFFNGHAMFLWGGSGRYDYPALGSSVPEEQQWRDLALFAAGGGNLWRPGHSSSSEEFVDAADAYGVMIVQPSGDGENGFNTPAADDVTLKTELHRDMIIRSQPPLDPGLGVGQRVTNHAVGSAPLTIDQTWDPITCGLRPTARRIWRTASCSAARSRAARSASRTSFPTTRPGARSTGATAARAAWPMTSRSRSSRHSSTTGASRDRPTPPGSRSGTSRTARARTGCTPSTSSSAAPRRRRRSRTASARSARRPST